MTRKLLLKNAAELVTCRGNGPKTGAAMAELGIVADGAMWIEDGVIRRVGTTAEVLSGLDASEAEVIDAAGRCAFPRRATGQERTGRSQKLRFHFQPVFCNLKNSRSVKLHILGM